jgi:GcrA cell cycle regulator
MEWNEDAIARLRELWAVGHSTAEIGRRMGISKNAVVGKAHRLELPARPSPIRREPGVSLKPAAVRRVLGPTLPPLPVEVEAQAPEAVQPVVQQPMQPPVRAPEPPPVRAAVLRPVAAPRSRSISCCWPIGEPGTKSFRFCDADATQGKPYCGEHAQLAYVKVRDRRDEAVA